MKSWKEENIKFNEYIEEDFDNILDSEGESLRYSLNSEYEFIMDLLEDSEVDFYDDSTEDENILAIDNGKSTYRFYFDEDDSLYTITEVMNGSHATKEDPDMGIWKIDDFDILMGKKGTIFRVLSKDEDGSYKAVAAIPLY